MKKIKEDYKGIKGVPRVDEDLATLEKKLDNASKNVQDIISNIEGSSSCTKNEDTKDDKKFTYFLYLGDKAIKENYYMGGVGLKYAEQLAQEAIKELGFAEISIFKAENNDKPKREENLEFVKTVKRDITNESVIQKLKSVDEELKEPIKIGDKVVKNTENSNTNTQDNSNSEKLTGTVKAVNVANKTVTVTVDPTKDKPQGEDKEFDWKELDNVIAEALSEN